MSNIKPGILGWHGFVFVSRNHRFLDIGSVCKYLIFKGIHAWMPRFPWRQNAVSDSTRFLQNNRDEIESFVSDFFLFGLLKCLLVTENIEGDIIELGSFKGGTATVMAHFLDYTGSRKSFYVCDSFEGHPYDDKTGTDRKGRFHDTNISYVTEKFKKFGVGDRIRVVKGRFEDSLPSHVDGEKFSFAFVDCDLYQSTKYVLDFLLPRMGKGSIIAFHDYGSARFGLTNAVHELCEHKGLKVNLYPVPHFQL